ncbi:MAG: tRNA lysidine(34) synthetase TilS [Lachnospiraceae bacterium]|nr:tRNA lysidine(34) synthetase TilS [Lachnospiraceae bacterium]
MTDKFLLKVRNFINKEKLVERGDRIVIGVSGGADSVALFKVLCFLREEYCLDLHVLTVNHGLRAEAKEECEYVQNLCNTENIDFTLIETDINALACEYKLGTEETGRKVRYRAFNDLAIKLGDNTKIAVAHNQNDQAETMLFHLFRGTGPKGLISIRPKRDNIIRPLLCVSRSEIEEWLNNQDIKFYIDASNLTDDYTRNKIRHNIIEYAGNNINANAVGHMAETAETLSDLVALADSIVDGEIEKRVKTGGNRLSLDTVSFCELNSYIKKAIIKRCIDLIVPNNKDITSRHLESVISILDNTESKSLNLPYGIVVLKENDTLLMWIENLSKNQENSSLPDVVLKGLKGESHFGEIRVKWTVFGRSEDFEVSKNQYTKSFDYDKITQNPVLRFPREGDFLTINNKLQKKKLSDYLIDEKIPKSLRNQIPIIADGSHVWWVIDHRISEFPKVSDNTKRILEIEITGVNDYGKASC